MIKVGIIGATGYAGVELVRLFKNHPKAQVVAISSISYEGQKLSLVYPNMSGVCDLVLENEDSVIKNCDVVFSSLPHGLSEAIARKCINTGKKMIDLGADFRLDDESDYKEWYGLNYKDKELHKYSSYSIAELNREEVKSAKIIGNAGCYPTSIGLGLAPAICGDFIDTSSIIIDSKSGITGAGRTPTQTSHFPDCNEAFSAYKTACHRHTPEIEQTLSHLAKKKIIVTFVPHLLPTNRGIESTIYANLSKDENLDSIHNDYINFYSKSKFVRVMALGDTANIKNVKYSNYCDISLHLDKRTNRLIVMSVIDNMVKGASGQAIQNMNIMFGLEEDCGLDFYPPAF